MSGLRKAEIDGLEWDAFNFESGILRFENTEHLELKSEESAAEIDLDPERITRFMAWTEECRSRFVIESPTTKRTPRSYRAAGHFNRLNRWLHSRGIDFHEAAEGVRCPCERPCWHLRCLPVPSSQRHCGYESALPGQEGENYSRARWLD